MNNNMDVSASQSSRHFNNTALDKSLAKEKVKIDVKNRFHKPCTLSIAKEKSDVLTLESKIFRGKVSPKPKLNVKKSENDSDNLSTSSDSSSHKKQKIKIQPSDLLTDPDKSAEEGEPSSDSIIESSSESRVESPKSSTNETKMSNDKFEARQEFEKSKLNDRLKKLSDQQSQISHSIKKDIPPMAFC